MCNKCWLDQTELLDQTLCPTACPCSARAHSVPLLVLCLTTHISPPPHQLSSDPACWDTLDKWDTPSFGVEPDPATSHSDTWATFFSSQSSGSPVSVGHMRFPHRCAMTLVAQHLASWRLSISIHFSPQCLTPFTGFCPAPAVATHLLPACLLITDTSLRPR